MEAINDSTKLISKALKLVKDFVPLDKNDANEMNEVIELLESALEKLTTQI